MKNQSYTQIERNHYNLKSKKLSEGIPETGTDFYPQYLQSWKTNSHRQAYNKWFELATSTPAATILDYCSGQGMHTLKLQNLLPEAKIFGFDISETSVELGKTVAQSLQLSSVPEFSVQDAHKTQYLDQQFDLLCNFGSLSSLEFQKAISEIKRVLKPDGYFLSIETFGHNPLANLKRKLNVLTGKRTQWAQQNILDMEKIEKIKLQFQEVQVYYFSFFTLFIDFLPFFKKTPLLPFTEWLDQKLFHFLPFSRKYAFKVVFIGKK
ncbi:MAG: class I SAM-dependent methyltransferase [Halobacteriovoraceae bacterium]|nr:class I SAM-dependent methyltransferase [Halobacteriovoraceae bacterium]